MIPFKKYIKNKMIITTIDNEGNTGEIYTIEARGAILIFAPQGIYLDYKHNGHIYFPYSHLDKIEG